jgi:L-asparaginase / beta-aspartyl-peptidase
MTPSNLPVLLVHAGAGEWDEGADEALAACEEALRAGATVLDGGGTSLAAVVAAVRALEENPSCNAGTGAVLTRDGNLELDASVMDGAHLRSGAVGALPPFAHPIDIAQAVLEDGRYHLLTGDGAASFARAQGFTPVAPKAMITERRRTELRLSMNKAGNTVGAVACDQNGNLASATSTGGLAGTDPGRIGDTPIVGAGTYANDFAACSCTGQGEAFARACAAFWATERTRQRDSQVVAEETVRRVRDSFGGKGGVILVDRSGNAGVARTAKNMPYGIARGEAKFVLAA